LPLLGGLTQTEGMASIAGLASTEPYKLLYDVVAAIAGGPGERAEALCRKFLHDGQLEGSALKPFPVRFNRAGVTKYLAGGGPPPVSAGALEVRFVADATVDDGRFANNGWLQECPDPITKISWENAILISPRLAREIGVYPQGSFLQIARIEGVESDPMGRENSHVAEITVAGRKIRGPIHV